VKSFVLPHGKEALRQALNALPKEKRWTIKIEPYKKPRSNDANAYWWGVVVTHLAEHCGYTPEEMHESLCGGYFGWKTVDFRGHKREIPRRTTTTPDTLGTMEFSALIEYGQQIAAEMSVRLPDLEWRKAG
jgi:hypothetical protein